MTVAIDGCITSLYYLQNMGHFRKKCENHLKAQAETGNVTQ